ncbi:MAG TPA: helix-turn-helix domain-containing protein [Nocardioidaceae bacterium]|jgi:AcrR family transcriptional regulator|nr:helix-turn-helix domain-containing protein [Nocardioidaceae bacterium]
MGRTRTGRAAPMAPDDRRRAIVDVVVPLLLEHGPDVTTRQVAEAAGIAEGTIFRVFPDKAALLMAAAEETMNPDRSGSDLLAALDGVATLREKVRLTAERMNARTDRVMAVMFALRRLGPSLPDHQGVHRPPELVLESARALQRLLTEVFEPHRDELTVDPGTAARLLRTLVLGSRHPGAFHDQPLTCEEITDVLLDGIRRRETGRREED